MTHRDLKPVNPPDRISVEKAVTVAAPRPHSAMCRLLDSPARKRGWPFICICGADKP